MAFKNKIITKGISILDPETGALSDFLDQNSDLTNLGTFTSNQVLTSDTNNLLRGATTNGSAILLPPHADMDGRRITIVNASNSDPLMLKNSAGSDLLFTGIPPEGAVLCIPISSGWYFQLLGSDEGNLKLAAEELSATSFATINDLYITNTTPTTVPYIDGSNKVASSAVTPTELGYLSGATSNIQNQINALGGGGGASAISVSSGAAQVFNGVAYADVTNLTVTITGTGNPLLINLQPDTSGNQSRLDCNTGTIGIFVAFVKNGVVGPEFRIQKTSNPEAHSLTYLDTTGYVGSVTYKVQIKSPTADSGVVSYYQLSIKELS